MILSITNHRAPAAELGFLLHKHPARLHSIDITMGKAYVFYPQVSDAACTAVLMLELDPVALVRQLEGPKGEDARLGQYVNGRPYVASSFLSVAISRAFSSTLKGQCKERPALVAEALPLTAELSMIRSSQGEPLLRDLFEPLGYRVTVESHELDPEFPEWGASEYFTLRLEGEVTLQALLNHLYVLIPVLDDEKHYWVSREEVDKLMRAGEGWLKDHPAREIISKRYLRHQRRFVNEALTRLTEEEEGDTEARESVEKADEAALESRINLNEHRLTVIAGHVESLHPGRVIDLGCGEGNLLRKLLAVRSIPTVAGMDVSALQLDRAVRRLQLDRMPEMERKRLVLFQGSLMYRDDRLNDYDVATIIEVIEHLDAPRLAAFERVVFEYARPRHILLTTPNRAYNALFPGIPEGGLRHRDHRFEWNQEEFQAWATRIGADYGYGIAFDAVGEPDPLYGPPTQLAIFSRLEEKS